MLNDALVQERDFAEYLFWLFLQIGLAVGDIDSIQQNAEYKRLSVKVIVKN